MSGAGVLLYVSAVTIQELAVACQMLGTWDRWHPWLVDRFGILPLTSRCAQRASLLQVAVGKPSRGTKSERRAAKDVWFRDAAIVGTLCANVE